MEKILNDPSVRGKVAESYVCCKLIANQNRELCDYYKFFKAPTLIFLDSRGYSRARIDGLVSLSQIVTDLDRYKD